MKLHYSLTANRLTLEKLHCFARGPLPRIKERRAALHLRNGSAGAHNPLVLQVISAYLLATVLVLIVLCMAVLIALAAKWSRWGRFHLFLSIIGTILIAVGGLEKMGWTTRPWSLGSPAQHFNDLVFRIVWLAGFGFLFVAWTIRMRMRREPLPHESYNRERNAERLETVSPKVVTIRQRQPEMLTPSA
jgi:hypothetical protein